MRSHPREAAELMAEKALDWLRPWANPLVWPRRVVFVTGLWYGALFLFAAIGLASERRLGVVAFVLAYLALSALVHVAIIVVLRYRMVFWDPVLIVFSAAALVRTANRLFTERTRGGPFPSAPRAGSSAPPR